MFDRLMLLAKGKVIYFNEAKYAVDYFAGNGYRCPELSNPADYFMSIMSIESIERPDTEDQDELRRSTREIT
jgi:ABC-type multidrug transport system ATPase subunit